MGLFARKSGRSSASSAAAQRALPFVTAALALGAWEALGRSGWYPPHLLPPPSAVWRALKDMAGSGMLWLDFKATGRRWVLGLVIGNVAGVAFGLLTGSSRWARGSVGTLLHALRAVPFLIMIPVAMLWLGLGEPEKVAIAAWGAGFPVWLNAQTSLLGVEPEYVWAARSLGARGWRLLWEVHLPRCLPFLLAGLRVSIATTTFALGAAEMSGAFEGLGFRIFYAYQMFQTDKMLADIIVMSVAALILDRLFVYSTRTLMPWQAEVTD